MKPIYYFVLLIIVGVGCSKKSVAPTGTVQDIQALFSAKDIVIREKINLKGQQIDIKNKRLTLQKGGSLVNGTIRCNQCTFIAPPEPIFDRVNLTGDWAGNTGYLEWWTGKNMEDAVYNLEVLTTMIQAGFQVELRQMVPIQAKSPTSTLNPHRLINLKGTDRTKSGLILMTKYDNQFYNYFQSDRGFNVRMENLTLMTKDFRNGIFSDEKSEYLLLGSYYQSYYNPGAKPSIDSIVIKNCDIRGNMSLANYGAHSDNQTLDEFTKNNKVKRVEVIGNVFQNVNSAFSFSNMGYDNITIKNNQILDFSEAFLSIPESGMKEEYNNANRKNKGYVLMEKNLFKNSRVVKVPSGRALSPCVIKGGEGSMDFIDNRLENLLSDSPDADVHTFYYTCSHPGRFTVRNNIIRNVCGRGSKEYPASLIKDRWTDQFVLENNTVTLDRESLVKIGVLKNKNEDLSKIKGDRFNYVFIQAGGQQELDKIVRIRNNTFSMPYVNLSTEMYDAKEFDFENNQVHIEYFGPSDIERSISIDNTFFLARQRKDRPVHQPAMDMKLRNNTVRIDKTGNRLFYYLHFPDGVQNGTPEAPDKNINYRNVILEDRFEVSETDIGISVPDGENQVYKPTIIGQHNSFFLKDAANVNHIRPNAKRLVSDIQLAMDNGSQSMSPFVFMPNSFQKIKIDGHSGKDISLMKYIYFISLYNLAKEENQLIQIRFSGKTKTGKLVDQQFSFALDQKSRNLFAEDDQGLFRAFNPSEANQKLMVLKRQMSAKNEGEVIPKLEVLPGNKHLKEAEIKLTNCENIQSCTIECVIRPIGYGQPTQAQFQKEVDKAVFR